MLSPLITARQRLRRLLAAHQPASSAAPLALESLETRTLFATFTVTASADAGVGSLRNAIAAANESPGADTILFDIIGATGAVRTINLGSPLPAITGTLTIDGTSQTGFNGAPLIEINGAQAGSLADGLVIQASNSAVRGLIINRFQGNGIRVDASNVTLRQNYIGLGNTGATDLGNAAAGIFVNNANNVTIGGPTAADRNLIAGNTGPGILISGPSASGHTIANNFFGTDLTGALAIASSSGLVASDAQDLVIRNNVFASSDSWALTIVEANSVTIAGNLVGLNAEGTAALANASGILIGQSTDITIGGLTAANRNVVSGNQGDAIDLVESSNAIIAGNYLGTSANGLVAIGNNGSAITLIDVTASLVGGDAAGAGNLIAANQNSGILISGQASASLTIARNTIGLSADGEEMGNSIGVFIADASNTTIRDNTIAFGTFGILVQDTLENSFDNVFRRNLIYSTDSTAIDLGSDGINFNDEDDADNGPNGLQNSPVITDVKIVGSTVTFTGTINSRPNTTYTLDFFLSSQRFFELFGASLPPGVTPTGLPTGGGQGRIYVGSVNVTTNAAGNASFDEVFTNVTVPQNPQGSATATGPDGTSEFSSAFGVDEGDLAVVAAGVSAVEDLPLTDILVATISDPLGDTSADQLTVLIDWGDDSTPSPGSITGIGDGLFQVRGSHTYAAPGNYTITISVQHDDERSSSDTAPAVVSPATIVGAGRDITATPDEAIVNRILATFIDADPSTTPADFTVTIDWGDQSEPTTGSLIKNASGIFIVRGSHDYASEGAYDITVTLEHQSGRTITAQASATIQDSPITPTPLRFAPVAGLRTGSIRTALFQDPLANAKTPLADYTATINWGNGRTTRGVVQRRRDGLLQVRGRTTYREHGTYSVTITLTHESGRSGQAASQARVIAAPIIPLPTTPIQLRGASFNRRLGWFLDANLFNDASAYSARIRWGDGAESAGSIRTPGEGLFSIGGTHTYSARGNYRVRINLLAPDGQTHRFSLLVRVTGVTPPVQKPSV